MWDTSRLPASGNFSLRKIALLFIAVITTAFLWTILSSPISHAADATWDGDAIVKDGNRYTKENGAIPDIPTGFQAYVFKPQNGTTAQVIYFPGNVDPTKQAFTAQQLTYEFVNGQYGGHGPPTTVSIDAKSTDQKKEETQCDVKGVGWIICATSRFLAGAMDNFFSWISGFLEVKPITNDTKSGLYQAWSIMLGLANMSFVLAFLVIIYSQITSVGFNNYNIKKMIPKLIIAAILVNASYYICAIAVDISNILGHSLHQTLVDIRNSLPSPNPGGVDLSWKNLTEYLLSGGTIAAAGFAGWAAFAGTAGASVTALVPLLFPVLIFGMLAFITALLVLAARQALITILIVISPLAFVAYLLPNTEKWFEKWRELFTTMLMVFPLFSLLFGGSQLASYIIIQNADKPSVAIFGLFIQAAPFALTPFLVKFSGGLVGRLAGMISSGTKGLNESATGWAQERVDKRRGIAMEQAARGRGTFLQRSAFRREKSRLDREAYKKRGEEAIDAGWHEDKRYRGHHSQFGYTEDRKKAAAAFATEHMEREALRSQTWQDFRGQRRLSEDVTKNIQGREQAAWEEAKSKGILPGNQFSGLATRAQNEAEQAQAIAYQTGTAQAMQRIEYANEIVKNEALARQAGGIDIPGGADSARAAALAALKKSKAESIAEGKALSEHFNLSASQRQALALGVEVTGTDDKGNSRTFNTDNAKYVQLAAMKQQVANGTVEEAMQIIMQTGKNRALYEHREVVVEAMLEGGLPAKATMMGGKTLDDIRAGRIQNTSDLIESTLTAIAKGKLSPEQLLNQDKTSMELIVDAVGRWKSGEAHIDGEMGDALRTEMGRLFTNARTALTDQRINVRLGERTNAMNQLVQIGEQDPTVLPPPPGTAPPFPPIDPNV